MFLKGWVEVDTELGGHLNLGTFVLLKFENCSNLVFVTFLASICICEYHMNIYITYFAVEEEAKDNSVVRTRLNICISNRSLKNIASSSLPILNKH